MVSSSENVCLEVLLEFITTHVPKFSSLVLATHELGNEVVLHD
jgi:hypothetical protein